jgi:hypothetical protein
MTNTIYEIATQLSRKLGKKWGIDPDDIRQEILLWCLRKGIDGNFANIQDEEEANLAARRATASMRWEGERYCRREKANREGYDPRDEAYYGLRGLQELLVTYYQAGIVEHSPIGASESVKRQKGTGAEHGTYLCSLLDVQAGLERIDPAMRQRLRLRFDCFAGMSDDRIASLSQSEIRDLTGMHHDTMRNILGTTGDQIRHRTETALKRLQITLGGPNPWNRPPVAAMAA